MTSPLLCAYRPLVETTTWDGLQTDGIDFNTREGQRIFRVLFRDTADEVPKDYPSMLAIAPASGERTLQITRLESLQRVLTLGSAIPIEANVCSNMLRQLPLQSRGS